MRRRYCYFYRAIFLGLSLAFCFIQIKGVIAQEGYPAQPQPTPTLAEPYPLTPAEQVVATAVPALIGGSEPPADSAAVSGPRLNVQPINPQANLGRYYLWGGFLAATFILGTTVYGATTLFVRRKD